MTKISWPAGTLLAPVPPALISSGTLENPNVMTAAWTGIVCSDPAMTYVSLRPSRYSHEIISKSGEFVINVPICRWQRLWIFAELNQVVIPTNLKLAA